MLFTLSYTSNCIPSYSLSTIVVSILVKLVVVRNRITLTANANTTVRERLALRL